jgi:putative pyruvate formate lyase activating enzyme
MDAILSFLEHCELCPRQCGVNRLRGERGFCGAGRDAVVAHHGPHFGEEPPISGSGGSGTIFFSPCNLRCVFCQNYQISHALAGDSMSADRLVRIFLDLEKAGVHNINLVSPTPYMPSIAVAITIAKERGLSIPLLYNTNAYENRETIRALAGLIDIYLPDLKYWSGTVGEKLSAGRGYPAAAMTAIEEMHAQVGDLKVEGGIAKKGLLIRHLVLPGGLAGTAKVVRWIKDRLGSQTALSLMSQYFPTWRTYEHPLINRRVRSDEYEPLVALLESEGFRNVYVQELESAQDFVPDFRKKRPFEGP